MGIDTTGDSEDVPESYSRSASAFWRALAVVSGGDGCSFHEALEAELAELTTHERVLAYALLSSAVQEPVGQPRSARPSAGEPAPETLFEEAIGRLSTLARTRRLVALALPDEAESAEGAEGHEVGLASLTESLWGDWLGAPPERRFVLAVMWALLGRLPLALDGAEIALELAQGFVPTPARATADAAGVTWLVPRTEGDSEVDAEPLVAFAIGRASALGDPGARVTLRELLKSRAVSQRTAFMAVAGLGEGLLVEGLWRLARLARSALSDEVAWSAALTAAAIAVATRSPNGRLIPPALCLSILHAQIEAEQVEAFLAVAPEASRREAVARALAHFERGPAELRAALAQALLSGRLDVEGARPEAPASLLRERSPQVLLPVLGLLEQVADALPQELKAALGRAYSDHPDTAVRTALARAIPIRRDLTVTRRASPGDLVALPPQALVRDDLDRLRVAIWSAESERVVELASCVPLDRRTFARESILSALEIPNAPLRRALIEAIGRIGQVSDAPRLLDAARRYRALEGTVAAAMRALSARAMAEGLAEIYRRRLKWADDEAVDDYCAIAGQEQVIHLRDALQTRFYPAARAGAARAIARLKAHEVVFALRAAALSDTQENARLAALAALMELTGTGPTSAELAGYGLLFKPTDELDDAVERAKEAGHAAIAGVRRALARGSWKRRRAACEVLSELPGDEAAEVLLGVLEDPDEDVRLAALEALVRRGWEPRDDRERTLRSLAARRARELAERPDELDQRTLLDALGLGGHVFRTEVLEVVRSLDLDVVEGDMALVAAARGDVMNAVRLPGGLRAVMRATDHTWQANPHRARYVRGLADLSVFEVADALSGPHDDWSWRAREAQAQALFRFAPVAADRAHPAEADARALERLKDLVLEEDDDVRRAALQSLALMGTTAAAEAIAAGLVSPFQEDRDVVARALGRLGRVALPVLERLMMDSWWESRHGAALALAQWRDDVQDAVDRLLVLAADAEYRVAQTAREALALHGLIPTTPAVVAAIMKAQTATIEGLEPWLGLHRAPTALPEVAHALDSLIEETPLDELPQRLGLVATFRAEHLALWLEQVALGVPPDGAVDPQHGPHRHLACRLAAADALRTLSRRACTVCQGERTVRCPACAGAGDVPCGRCVGKGVLMVACPDPECTAHGTLRRIDSKRCATCRGRGEVQVACTCDGAKGRAPCTLCEASGRLVCAACAGSGEASFD